VKRGFAILAAAACALAGAMAVRATPPDGVNEAAILEDAMPRTLAEYGFFIDAREQVPREGVTPYWLNTPLYSDGADKLRFVYIPDGEQALANGADLLLFPVGTALIKTFAFGRGEERRLIETRLLLHRENGWVALPYRWNEEQTEARLAVAGGRTEVTTPAGETISYRIPNKNQCKECHGVDDAVVPIGPKARNMSATWLAGLVESGSLDRMPAGANSMPYWSHESSGPLELRARAYLDVNCAHCHRPGATASNSGLDLRWEQRDPEALGVMKRPVAAGRGSGGHLFDIVPGEPDASIMVHRMRSSEPGVAMPELGKATVDEDGVAIVERWIAEMRR